MSTLGTSLFPITAAPQTSLPLMRITTLFVALTVSGTGFPLLSSAQFQLAGTDVFGTSSTNCVRTTDGGMITTHAEGDGIVLRKYDSEGAVIWNKFLEDTNPGSQATYGTPGNLCRDGSGGAFLALGLRTVVAEANHNDEDTAWYHILVTHIHSNGSADLRILERFNIYSDLGFQGWAENFLVASADGENVVVATTFDVDVSHDATDLVQLNSTMEPVWARSVGDLTSWSDYFPVYEEGLSHTERSLAFTPGGQLVYAHADGLATSDLELLKLTTTGDKEWARSYTYTNTVWGSQFNDIIVDANDRVHAVGTLALPTGAFVLMPIIDPDGQLHHTSIYATNSFYYETQIGLTSDGRRIIHSGGNTMVCDTLGSVAPIKQLHTIPFGEQNVHCEWWSSDVYDDMYCASGKVVEQHQITSFTNNYQSVISMGVDQLGTCFHVDSFALHYDVPEAIMLQEDVVAEQSLDIMAHYTALPGDGILISDLAPPTSVDLCSLIIGIEDNASPRNEPIVRGNLVAAGAPLSLTQPINGRIEVTDMSGRVVRTVPVNGSTTSLSSNGWSAGVYLLRAINTSGRVIGTQRVIVE